MAHFTKRVASQEPPSASDSPPTKSDLSMSMRHAKDSVKFNLRHARDHMKAAKKAKARLAQVRQARVRAI